MEIDGQRDIEMEREGRRNRNGDTDGKRDIEMGRERWR